MEAQEGGGTSSLGFGGDSSGFISSGLGGPQVSSPMASAKTSRGTQNYS